MRTKDSGAPSRRDHGGHLSLAVANALRGLIEGLPEAIVLVAPNGRIFAANRSVVAALAVEEDALVGAPFSLLFEERSYDIGRILRSAAKDPRPLNAKFKRRSGSDGCGPVFDIELRFTHVKLGPEVGAPTIIVVRILSMAIGEKEAAVKKPHFDATSVGIHPHARGV